MIYFREIYWTNICSCTVTNITINHFSECVDGVATARCFFKSKLISRASKQRRAAIEIYLENSTQKVQRLLYWYHKSHHMLRTLTYTNAFRGHLNLSFITYYKKKWGSCIFTEFKSSMAWRVQNNNNYGHDKIDRVSTDCNCDRA